MPIDRSVTLENWLVAPYNRKSFRRVREVLPTARIARDERPSAPLEADLRDLDGVRFAGLGGEPVRLADQLETTYTDGLVVVHGGRLIYERYLNGLRPDDTHLLMSVSKSYCGTLAGILQARGAFGMDDLVTELAPDLAGTSFEGATVQHLLDMRAGTDCPEDYDVYADPEADHPLLVYERAAGYRPQREPGRAPGILEHMRTLPNASEHGGPFEYRSVLTNVVAHVLESVTGTRYPDLLATELWAPLGPEHDAEIMLDPRGFPVVEGGMCCTLRDLVRLGLAYLADGRVGDGQVIPAAWVAETRRGDASLAAAFAASESAETFPGGLYHNAWWVIEPDQRFAALGIHGQMIYVDRPNELVLARLASEPEAVADERVAALIRAADAIVAAVA